MNRVIREPIRVEEIVFSDSDLGKATVWVGDSLLGMESSSKTRWWRRTLELAAKVGSRSMRILVDSGSTGNYIDARECTDRKLQIQKEDTAEELRLADGSTIKTEGRVRVHVKCGEYRGTLYARVFPQMNKQMILGIPWLSRRTRTLTGLRAQLQFGKGKGGFPYPWPSLSKGQQEMMRPIWTT